MESQVWIDMRVSMGQRLGFSFKSIDLLQTRSYISAHIRLVSHDQMSHVGSRALVCVCLDCWFPPLFRAFDYRRLYNRSALDSSAAVCKSKLYQKS